MFINDQYNKFFTPEKLKIEAYKVIRNDILDVTEEELEDTFIVMFNPETYSLTHKNKFNDDQSLNSTGVNANYILSAPTELKLRLIIDGNGVLNSGYLKVYSKENDKVHKQVERFLKLTSEMNGETHAPCYLKLNWGHLYFPCHLKSVDIKYTQFNASGHPLRAELDTVFIKDVATEKRLKEEGKSSPDLTHYRIVGAHDQLPLMCEKIYGSSSYYIQVAKANKLKNFRNLQPGQKIYFPPIEK